jgi:hypothetical protein
MFSMRTKIWKEAVIEPNFKYFPGISLEGLRESMKKFG